VCVYTEYGGLEGRDNRAVFDALRKDYATLKKKYLPALGEVCVCCCVYACVCVHALCVCVCMHCVCVCACTVCVCGHALCVCVCMHCVCVCAQDDREQHERVQAILRLRFARLRGLLPEAGEKFGALCGRIEGRFGVLLPGGEWRGAGRCRQ